MPEVVRSGQRLVALDGVRGVAIALVLAHHAVLHPTHPPSWLVPWLSLGRLAFTGVDLFFVLSGFLIGGILLDSRDAADGVRQFYARRALRILPLYGLLLAFSSLRALPALRHSLGASESQIPFLAYVTFTQNVFMALRGDFGVGVLAATWSLAVEEQFYLVAPFVVRCLRPKQLRALLIGVVLLAPVWRYFVGHWHADAAFAARVLTPCRADALGLGVLIALLVRSPAAAAWFRARRVVLQRVLLLLAAGMLVFTLVPESSPWFRVAGYSWFAGFYAIVLLLALGSNGAGRLGFLHRPWLTALAPLAYGAYLFNLPAIELCRRLLRSQFGLSVMTDLIGGVTGVALSLLAAAVCFRYIERPLLTRRVPRSPPPPPQAART